MANNTNFQFDELVANTRAANRAFGKRGNATAMAQAWVG